MEGMVGGAIGETGLTYPSTDGLTVNSPWSRGLSLNGASFPSSPGSDSGAHLPPPTLHFNEAGQLSGGFSAPAHLSSPAARSPRRGTRLYPAPPPHRRQTVLKPYPQSQLYAGPDYTPALSPGDSYPQYDQSAHRMHDDIPTLPQLSYNYTHALSPPPTPQSHPLASNLHPQQLHDDPLDVYTLPAPAVFDFQRSQSSVSDQSVPALDASETEVDMSSRRRHTSVVSHSSAPQSDLPVALRRSSRSTASNTSHLAAYAPSPESSIGASPATPNSSSSWTESEAESEENEDDQEWVPGGAAGSKRRSSRSQRIVAMHMELDTQQYNKPLHFISDGEDESDTLTKAGTARKNRPIPLPVPVPGLVKKSRGRKVPIVVVSPSATVVSEGDYGYDGDTSLSTLMLDRKARKARNGGSGLQRGYMCTVTDCGKAFVRSEHLKRHVRSIHTHEKPHLCPFITCNKRFARRDNLSQHYRVHLA